MTDIMTDTEIKHGNILIHKFMGNEIREIYGQGEVHSLHKTHEIKDGKDIPIEWNFENLTPEQLSEVSDERWHNVEDSFNGLRYNGDWNWLMSIVDKLESTDQILVFFEIGRHRMVKFMNRPWQGFGDEKFTDTKIQATFKVVVELITVINKNKNEINN